MEEYPLIFSEEHQILGLKASFSFWVLKMLGFVMFYGYFGGKHLLNMFAMAFSTQRS